MSAPSVVAVIIGRAGSKGLPGKNALVIAGHPMVAHSIAAARDARSVDAIIVTTDCPQMAATAEALGVPTVDRPADLASDTATVDDAVRHAVRAAGNEAPIVVILYANVPVRPTGLIDRAVETLRASGADSVQSYADVGKHHPYWMVRLNEEGRVEAHHPNPVYRRQDLPQLYLPDGGVIAVTRASLDTVVPGEPHAFLGADRVGIATRPGDVVDIDTPADLAVAEARLLAEAAS